jgi:hypothetical protein
MCFLLAGCHPGLEEAQEQTASKIIVRASSADVIGRSASNSDALEPIVFTGNDIEWYDEKTKEILFKNNYSITPMTSSCSAISFYIGDEYLFSSMFVSSVNSQIFNSPVLYYNITENKYFLTDGYPGASVLQDPQKAQALRDENMRIIASEWNKFIDRLKIEGKYKK